MQYEQTDRILSYISQHVDLTDDEQQLFVSKLRLKSYKKNEFIGKQGEIARVQSFIITGGARMYLLDDDGNEHIIQFGIENWWLADLGSFITQTPADYSVQCFEETDVYQLTYDDLQQLYIDIPPMERFYRIIIQNAYVNAQKRIVHKTMLTAQERYVNFGEQYAAIEQRVPQYMIASYLGITKEFLSKVRRQLSK